MVASRGPQHSPYRVVPRPECYLGPGRDRCPNAVRGHAGEWHLPQRRRRSDLAAGFGRAGRSGRSVPVYHSSSGRSPAGRRAVCRGELPIGRHGTPFVCHGHLCDGRRRPVVAAAGRPFVPQAKPASALLPAPGQPLNVLSVAAGGLQSYAPDVAERWPLYSRARVMSGRAPARPRILGLARTQEASLSLLAAVADPSPAVSQAAARRWDALPIRGRPAACCWRFRAPFPRCSAVLPRRWA